CHCPEFGSRKGLLTPELRRGHLLKWLFRRGRALCITEEYVLLELSNLWILPNRTLDGFEVLYQDAVIDPTESESVGPKGSPEAGLRRWQNHAVQPRLLTAAEIESGLSHASAPARHSGAAASVPRVHHANHHHEA